MADHLNNNFIHLVNQNLGIAHKVASVYFQNADDRADVLQEIMYQLWRSYPGFNGQSKFSTWMYSVCLNTALTYSRKTKKQQSETLSPDHYQIADSFSKDQEELTKLLRDAIANLSALNKAIVLLYLEDMSYEEIASVMGLTRSNVSVRLVRIKRELETQLKQKI